MVNFEIPPELADLDFDYAPSSAAFDRNSKSLLHYSTRQRRTNKRILNKSSAITRQKETHKRRICESPNNQMAIFCWILLFLDILQNNCVYQNLFPEFVLEQ